MLKSPMLFGLTTFFLGFENQLDPGPMTVEPPRYEFLPMTGALLLPTRVPNEPICWPQRFILPSPGPAQLTKGGPLRLSNRSVLSSRQPMIADELWRQADVFTRRIEVEDRPRFVRTNGVSGAASSCKLITQAFAKRHVKRIGREAKLLLKGLK
jgi:hypothetical protein